MAEETGEEARRAGPHLLPPWSITMCITQDAFGATAP